MISLDFMNVRVMVGACLLGLVGATAGGCTSTKSGGEQTCRPGESQQCTGPGGCIGGQVCEEGIRFGECICGAGGAGGGGGAAGVAGSGGSGGSGLPPREVSCDYYCALMEQNCTGTNEQYTSNGMCVGSCLGFEPGTLQDDAGPTLGCRINSAEQAEANPDVRCTIAGPSGGGSCGSFCESYCAIFVNVCTDPDVAYADANACLTACASFAEASGDYNAFNFTSGDSVQCRIYHAASAAADPANGSDAIHCPHSREVPNANCLSQ